MAARIKDLAPNNSRMVLIYNTLTAPMVSQGCLIPVQLPLQSMGISAQIMETMRLNRHLQMLQWYLWPVAPTRWLTNKPDLLQLCRNTISSLSWIAVVQWKNAVTVLLITAKQVFRARAKISWKMLPIKISMTNWCHNRKGAHKLTPKTHDLKLIWSKIQVKPYAA